MTIAHAQWVPADRSLHLVDIENLLGDPLASPDEIERALAIYRRVAAYRTGDHVYIGCDARMVPDVHRAWPAAHIRAGRGRDGADLALLAIADVHHIVTRYDRVIVASGDGIFAPMVSELCRCHVRVELVSRRGSLSRRLVRLAACYPMPELPSGKQHPYRDVAQGAAG